MNKYRTALVFSLVEKNVSLIIRFASSIILARLLTPEDFGIFAIASTFVFFAEALQQVGIPNYIIKEREITKEKLGSAMTLMLLIGVAFSFLAFTFAGSLASFYDSESLKELCFILGALLLVSPFSVVERSLLRKNLDFARIARIDVLGLFVGTLASIVLVIQGLGVFSLAWGLFIQYIVTALLFYSIKSQSVNAFYLSTRHIKEILTFTFPLLAASFIAQGGNSFPNLLIGKVFQQRELGFYSRAEGASNLFGSVFIQGVQSAVAPIFAKLNQESKDISTPILKVINIQCSLGWPFYFLIAVFSDEIIELLYGQQWSMAASLMPYFCVSQALMITTSLYSDVMEGLGHSQSLFKLQILLQGVKGLSLLSSYVLVDSFFEFTVCFLLIYSMLRMLVMVVIANVHLSVSIADFARTLIFPFLSLCFFAGPLLVLLNIFTIDNWAMIIFSTLGATVVFVLGLWICNPIIRNEAQKLAKWRASD